MYKYRAYESSLTRNSRVKENGNMGRHTSDSPPPLIGDGKRRPIRDRLQSITSAMSWIKEELVSGAGRETGHYTKWCIFQIIAVRLHFVM